MDVHRTLSKSRIHKCVVIDSNNATLSAMLIFVNVLQLFKTV